MTSRTTMTFSLSFARQTRHETPSVRSMSSSDRVIMAPEAKNTSGIAPSARR